MVANEASASTREFRRRRGSCQLVGPNTPKVGLNFFPVHHYHAICSRPTCICQTSVLLGRGFWRSHAQNCRPLKELHSSTQDIESHKDTRTKEEEGWKENIAEWGMEREEPKIVIEK